jgi:predicted patatin/cPLA2 family phospholipase
VNDQSLNTALVVEGGALRGVFSTGLLDGFLEAQFNPFNLFIGVSSGASNLAAYLAGMIGRNARIYMEYSLRPDFISFSKFFQGGHLLDLDWLWDVTIREIRLDLGTVYSQGKPFIVVLTDVQTGDAIYQLTSAGDLEQVLKASSAMPLFYRDYPRVGGRPMTDGGVADALPVGEAIRRGARRIMVIRSRHRDYRKRSSPAEQVMRWHVRQYPLLRQAMARRLFANRRPAFRSSKYVHRRTFVCRASAKTASSFRKGTSRAAPWRGRHRNSGRRHPKSLCGNKFLHHDANIVYNRQ